MQWTYAYPMHQQRRGKSRFDRSGNRRGVGPLLSSGICTRVRIMSCFTSSGCTSDQHPYIYGSICCAGAYQFTYLNNQRYRDKFHSVLSRLINCKSELFLYSKRDKLCTNDIIESAYCERNERFIGRRRVVSKTCFNSSPHVAHFLHYPKEYKNECWSLLERAEQ